MTEQISLSWSSSRGAGGTKRDPGWGQRPAEDSAGIDNSGVVVETGFEEVWSQTKLHFVYSFENLNQCVKKCAFHKWDPCTQRNTPCLSYGHFSGNLRVVDLPEFSGF